MATNERFQHLLEGAINASYDKKLKDSKRVPRKRVIERLRLYGVGFGGRLPTISKKKRVDSDAEVMAIIKAGCTLGRCASTYGTRAPDPPASASGDLRYEHEALYKAFVHGHLSQVNPERMFFSSVHANADCSGGHRPPWYYGFHDPGGPVDGARYLQTAKRYGYRGSSGMRDHHPPRSADSFRTIRHGTPLFLRQQNTIVDEWTPKIVAGPPSLFMPLYSSPKMWPANTMYVEGYKGKHKSKSAIYNKETTVNAALKGPDSRAAKVVELEEEERTALDGALEAERRNLWCYDTDERGLRTADLVGKVEDELRFSPHLISARSARGSGGGRLSATQRTQQLSNTRNLDGNETEDPSLDEGSAGSSRVLESGPSGSQQEPSSTSYMLSPGNNNNDQGNAGDGKDHDRRSGAWARGSQYWPKGKKGQGKGHGKGKADGKKANNKQHRLMTAAHADYQERRKGSRMQLSRSETILIRNRPPKPSETPPEEEQPEESPSAAELLRSSGGKGGKQKGKKGAKAAEGSRRRQMSLVQYGLRWHAVRHLYDVILNSRLPGRPGTSLNLVASLCTHLQTFATANEAKTMIGREAFINALLGKYGSLILDSKANLIFSTFDPVNLNRIHYVHLVACLSILERPGETAMRKLLNLWHLYKDHRRDRNVLDNIVSLLTTCCTTAVEHAQMERLVRRQLIPYCYRAIALKPSTAVKSQLESFKQAGPTIKPGNTKKAHVQAARHAEEEEAVAAKRKAAAEAAASGEGGNRATAGRGAMPDSKETDVVYNICNEALEEEDFGQALAACPEVLNLFDEQMKSICYQQNRRSMEDVDRERAREEAGKKKFDPPSDRGTPLGSSGRRWGEEDGGEGGPQDDDQSFADHDGESDED